MHLYLQEKISLFLLQQKTTKQTTKQKEMDSLDAVRWK